MTFSECLQSRKVEAAKRMLLDPLASIAEVSAWCGFTSPAYFARVFRRQVGCSPREYSQNPRKQEVRDQGDLCSRA
jgi:AraC-like DNA-binding protein